MLKKLAHWALCKSPWVCHLNGGSCNNCDIEIVASLMPRFDLERFGILLQGSPRHADVLLCTGPITRQIRDRIIRVYEQTPDPKFVIAVGTCGMSGRPFYGKGSYNVLGGVDRILPVDMYIPGCPPRPDAITYGVLKLLSTVDPKIAEAVAELEKNIPGIEDSVQESTYVES
ncbi:MAG: NADH-quinone oxidoreductase subunit B family protein [candidate division WS1 bacterium]|jgi:NADH-quinone oxidoreductase B subunit|nr:NADH-quinone oxidoreductase subunit B family protein [candidate division WS1 bacterium]